MQRKMVPDGTSDVCTGQKAGQDVRVQKQWFVWGLDFWVLRKLVNGREYRAKCFEDGSSELSLFFRNIVNSLWVCNALYTMGSMDKKKERETDQHVIYSWYSLCCTWGLKNVELSGNSLTRLPT